MKTLTIIIAAATTTYGGFSPYLDRYAAECRRAGFESYADEIEKINEKAEREYKDQCAQRTREETNALLQEIVDALHDR